MSNEKIAPETSIEETPKHDADVEKPAEDGKLLLGKKVLRHFGVKSDVQAGTYSVVGRCR